MLNSPWTHPDLGPFKRQTEYGSTEWHGLADIPAFAAFRFRGSRPFRGSKRVPIRFASDTEEFVPSDRMAKLAAKVVTNGESLAARIRKAFYRDLLGIGPASGMWWHGDEDARRFCGEVLLKRIGRDTLASPDDFELLLGEPSITIWDELKPLARIDFASAFEDEHGAEALTNGTTVLGLGYQGDAQPYVKNRG